jgi:dolichol-phosphate mannosyltransferase
VDPLVIIPTYNERDNLPLIVSRLLAIDGLRVLVVDDASPDGTGEVADRAAADAGGRMTVLHRTGARGLGLSYVEAMHRALNLGATHICQMDCDLSHDPGDVPRLLAATSEADMVIGSRYVAGGRIENWPMRRVVLSAFANRYVRTITGLQINDCTSGFRCWRREALARLPIDRIRSDGYAFLVEMAWEAAAAGCRVTEVPITFVERRQGASKLSWRVVLESAILPWRLGLRARI